MTRLIVGGLLIVACGLTVSAYSFSGRPWSSETSQVWYYVNAKTHHMSEAQALDAIQRAAVMWNDLHPDMPQLTYGGRTSNTTWTRNGLTEIMFSPDTSSQFGGQVKRWFSGDGRHVEEVDMILRHHVRDFFAEDQNCYRGTYVRDLVTHEFGHVLGLGHSSVSLASMYPTMRYCKQHWRTLTYDDRNGVLTLYPSQKPFKVTPHLDATAFVNTRGRSSVRLTWVLNNDPDILVERNGIAWRERVNDGHQDFPLRGHTSWRICDLSHETCTPLVHVQPL